MLSRRIHNAPRRRIMPAIMSSHTYFHWVFLFARKFDSHAEAEKAHTLTMPVFCISPFYMLGVQKISSGRMKIKGETFV